MIRLNQTTVTEFFEKSKVVFSAFSIIKNIVALSFVSSLPITLIFCFKSRFSNLICLLKSIAISLYFFKCVHILIDYQLHNNCFY